MKYKTLYYNKLYKHLDKQKLPGLEEHMRPPKSGSHQDKMNPAATCKNQRRRRSSALAQPTHMSAYGSASRRA